MFVSACFSLHSLVVRSQFPAATDDGVRLPVNRFRTKAQTYQVRVAHEMQMLEVPRRWVKKSCCDRALSWRRKYWKSKCFSVYTGVLLVSFLFPSTGIYESIVCSASRTARMLFSPFLSLSLFRCRLITSLRALKRKTPLRVL